MELHLLEPQDAEIYRALRLEALQAEPLAFGAAYEEWLARPIEKIRERIGSLDGVNFTLGAFVDGRLVGVASFARNEGVKFRHAGWVGGVYVTPSARGQGIAKMLMAALLGRVRSYPGLEQITLAVSHTQEAARKLYRSLGFEVWGYERHALKVGGQYTDFEHMVLYLKQPT